MFLIIISQPQAIALAKLCEAYPKRKTPTDWGIRVSTLEALRRLEFACHDNACRPRYRATALGVEALPHCDYEEKRR
jgi:hypothetical protein